MRIEAIRLSLVLVFSGCGGGPASPAMRPVSGIEANSKTAAYEVETDGAGQGSDRDVSSPKAPPDPLEGAIAMIRLGLGGDAGAFEKADKLLGALIAADPDNVDALYYLALNRIAYSRLDPNKGRLELTLIGLEKALRDHPDDARLYFAKGSLLWVKGEQPAAFEAMERSLALDGTNVDALMQYGKMNLAVRDLSRAKQTFERVNALNPTLYWSHFYLGIAQRSLSDLDGAENSLKRAEALDPSQYAHLFALARVALLRENAWCGAPAVTAKKYFKQFIERVENAPPPMPSRLAPLVETARNLIGQNVDCEFDEADVAEMERLQQEALERERESMKQSDDAPEEPERR